MVEKVHSLSNSVFFSLVTRLLVGKDGIGNPVWKNLDDREDKVVQVVHECILLCFEFLDFKESCSVFLLNPESLLFSTNSFFLLTNAGFFFKLATGLNFL